jgi:predicted GNAT family acetyltransferase
MSTTIRKIEQVHDSKGGELVIREHDHVIAKMTYRHLDDGRVAADHTFVDGSLRGQGIAGQLLEALVDLARASRWTVVAECSYVARALAEKPEIADVVRLS